MINPIQLKQAGFSDEEIDQYFNSKLKIAGFSQEEIDDYLKKQGINTYRPWEHPAREAILPALKETGKTILGAGKTALELGHELTTAPFTYTAGIGAGLGTLARGGTREEVAKAREEAEQQVREFFAPDQTPLSEQTIKAGEKIGKVLGFPGKVAGEIGDFLQATGELQAEQARKLKESKKALYSGPEPEEIKKHWDTLASIADIGVELGLYYIAGDLAKEGWAKTKGGLVNLKTKATMPKEEIAKNIANGKIKLDIQNIAKQVGERPDIVKGIEPVKPPEEPPMKPATPVEKAPEAVIPPAAEAVKKPEVKEVEKVPETVTPVPEMAKPEIKPISPELEPLAQDAKKYKSAEEFVKSQGDIYYRTSDEPFNIKSMGEEGVVVSSDKKLIEDWQKIRGYKNIEEIVVSPEAKILKRADIPSEFIQKEGDINFIPLTKQSAIIKYAKEKGYDGVENYVIRGGKKESPELIIWNPAVIKTKSQLINFYNQAKGIPLPKPEPSVKKFFGKVEITRYGARKPHITKSGEYVNPEKSWLLKEKFVPPKLKEIFEKEELTTKGELDSTTVWPKEETQPLELWGYIPAEYLNKKPVYVFRTPAGENIAINKYYYDYLNKHIPNLRLEGLKPEHPVVIFSGNEKAGLVMPFIINESDLLSKTQPIKKVSEAKSKIKPESVGAASAYFQKMGSDISDLAKSLDTLKTKKIDIPERITLAQKLAQKFDNAKDSLSVSFANVKAVSAALIDAYKNVPVWTNFDDALGKYVGALQRGAFEARKFAINIKKAIPDKVKREAIINYIQAGGDHAILTQRAQTSAANPKTRHFAQGYELATKLTPEEKTFAENVRNYFEAKLDQAIEAGVLDHGIENYVSQIFKKDSKVGKKLAGEISAGKLRTDPFFAKRRIYESYFEAEQAGEVPKNKDIGAIIVAYDRAFNGAIAARAFIKHLFEGKAKDGRPLVHIAGAGRLVESKKGGDLTLIKPKVKPEEVGDYKLIDHPALKKWKWVAEDENGNPIMLEGDMWVHPEIYKTLKNILSTSALRRNPITRAILQTIATLKGMLLSFSGFHQFQEGLHATFHKIDPFNVPEIDINHPVISKLIDHGMLIASYNAEAQFAEGLSATGLVHKIPGIGPYLQRYTEYLFQDYIPRLKCKLGIEAYERNKMRYPDLSDDQILSITADQVNAAFGELNYMKMGRNPTLQDVLRLVLLAPDFLEARMRFVGQALKPYGKGIKGILTNEQFMAVVLRGAAGLWLGARVINAILNNGKTYPDKPFSIVYKDKEYILRSIPGDLWHLLSDPRSFVYYRLNPTTVRTMVEFITQRNAWGQYRDIEDQIKDFFATHIPIPFQKKGPAYKWYHSFLQSIGVGTREYRTPFQQEILDIYQKRIVVTPNKEDRERLKLINQYAEQLKSTSDNEKRKKIVASIKKDIEKGNIYSSDVPNILERMKDPAAHGLKHLSLKDIADIWDKTNDEEKQKYAIIVAQKIINLWNRNPEEFRSKKIQKLLNYPEIRQYLTRESSYAP